MLRFGFLISIVCLAMLLHFEAVAAEDPVDEEIGVYLDVKGLGGSEIDAVIRNKSAYLSITTLFNLLKIKNQLSVNQDTVSGFFINQQQEYLIDQVKNQIILAGQVFKLDKEALIQTPSGLYLRTDVLGKVFSLNCVFDFSTLSVSLSTRLELPVILEKKREQFRKNLSGLKKDLIADTTIKRNDKGFNLGAADWALSSVQTGGTSATTASLQLGAVIGGGETTLAVNYQDKNRFNLRQQYYQWHYADNENPLLRQIVLGKLAVQPLSSLTGSVIGVQLSNASTIFRKSQGTYTLSNITRPDWMVELYVNNVLVDYVKADAAGFYSFQVPVVYGSSLIKLRLLGPYREEEIQEQQIVVPYSFLPKGELEYTISNGMVEDGKQSRYSRTAFKYGQSAHLTLGGGLEYYSKITAHPYIPFVNASWRPVANLFLSAEHALDVRTKANASYRLPHELLFEADYTRYKAGQQAILNSSVEERKLMISKQYRKSHFSLYSRLSVNQIVYPVNKQLVTDILLSCMWRGVSTNLTTYALFNNQNDPLIYSTLAFSLKLPAKTTLRPQAQYAYDTGQMNSYRIEMERQLFGSGYLNVAFDHNLLYHTKGLTVGLRFDLSFVRTAFSVTTNKYQTSTSQSFNGGIVFDKQSRYLKFNNRSNVSRSGLVIYPFLDVNGNHKQDPGEPKLTGLQLKVNGGRIENDVQDTTIRVMELEPFADYLIELNPSSFDNIAWQLENKTYKVTAAPNQFKTIAVPVQVYGEVSGKVMMAGGAGLERISVTVFGTNGKAVKSMLSDNEGYFDFLGLPADAYTLKLDPLQLNKLKMKTASPVRSFKIRPTPEGDVVADVNFIISKPDL